MAQHDYIIANQSGAAFRADLNNGLAAIVSQNSGATAPSTTYAYQWWADTTTGLLKIRNAANNAWITLFQLDGEWSTLAVENGTAAAPSIYFKDSGTDTGLYSPGADQVAVATNGTARLYIASDGKVGIGTTSPSQLLTVTGGNALINGITVGRAPAGDNTTNVGAGNLGSNTGADNQAFGVSVLSANTTGVQNVGVGYTTLVTNSIGSYNTAVGVTALRFGTGSNNTGLGWNAGAANTGSTCTFIGHNAGADCTTGSNNTIIGSIAGTAGLSDTVIIGAGTTERLRIDSSGRLLVGTSTSLGASALFQSAAANGITFEGFYSAANAAGPNIILSKSRGSTGSPSVVSSGDYCGIIRFRGYDGTDYDSEVAYISAEVDGTPGANDMPGRLVFSTTADGAASPTERMRIASSGVITMASTHTRTYQGITVAEYSYDPGTGLPAAGQIVISCKGNDGAGGSNGVGLTRAATSWSAYSDERAKADLVPIDDGLSKVSTLRSVTGRYLDDEPGTSRSFLIAQDVQAVLPEAVDAGDPDKLSLRYTEVIPLLVAALKEAKERIETLETKVAALEAA